MTLLCIDLTNKLLNKFLIRNLVDSKPKDEKETILNNQQNPTAMKIVNFAVAYVGSKIEVCRQIIIIFGSNRQLILSVFQLILSSN